MKTLLNFNFSLSCCPYLFLLAVTLVNAGRRSNGDGRSPYSSSYSNDGSSWSDSENSIAGSNSKVVIKQDDLEKAFEAAVKDSDADMVWKPNKADAGILMDDSAKRLQSQVAQVNDSKPISQVSLVFESVSRYLIKKYNLKKDEVADVLKNANVRNVKAAQSTLAKCDAIYTRRCKKSKYRTADGSCNNPKYLNWGRAFECFLRFGDPDFEDGLSIPRASVSGGPLPNPRVISQDIHKDISRPSSDFTLMLMQFGQLVSHDINFTPDPSPALTQPIPCCNVTGTPHPFCLPIQISPEDSFFKTFQRTCMDFLRSSTCTPYCGLGPRFQINQVTSFLDLSVIYGSSLNQTKALRTFVDGKMSSQGTNVGELLPKSFTPDSDQCSIPAEKKFCFQAGDARVNQNPGIATLQTLFLRQHNRLADKLKAIFTKANDEFIFQEARRIAGAQFQAIIYGEYLPVVLGPNTMKVKALNVFTSGNSIYNPNVDPTIRTEFATAAYRFGHSLIQNNFEERAADESVTDLPLKDTFFAPFSLYTGSVDTLLKGMSDQKAQTVDPNVVNAVRNFLYKNPTAAFGLDLAAININRGRDHGLPKYTTMVNLCFPETTITDFEDLKAAMPVVNVNNLKKVYKNVNDIDLFTGGLSEFPIKDSILGSTFACLVSEQFKYLKYGDSFYFEHEQVFSASQLSELRKTTLAEIICYNSVIEKIRSNVFLPFSPLIDCKKVHDINLSYWSNEVQG